MLSLLGQICDIIVLIFIFANDQIVKNNLTIWSHCWLSLLKSELRWLLVLLFHSANPTGTWLKIIHTNIDMKFINKNLRKILLNKKLSSAVCDERMGFEPSKTTIGHIVVLFSIWKKFEPTPDKKMFCHCSNFNCYIRPSIKQFFTNLVTTYLPTCLPAYLPTYLPTYLPMWHCHH